VPRFIRGTAWYSVSEETLRALIGLAILGVLLVIGYRAYVEWDEYTLESRATETLNGARTLLETLTPRTRPPATASTWPAPP
jgi:hypothetical protein